MKGFIEEAQANRPTQAEQNKQNKKESSASPACYESDCRRIVGKWLDERTEADAPIVCIAGVCGELDKYEEKLAKIEQWCEAYPINVFPEPDFKKASRILKENGMNIDAISASNMRHVLKGVKRIIEA